MSSTSVLFESLFDDAAVFPPGNMPLADAIPAHASHASAPYRDTIGPFVLAAKDLPDLAVKTVHLPPASFPLSITLPLDELAAGVSLVAEIPALVLKGIEASVPKEMVVTDIVHTIRERAPGGVPVYVEVPRDDRRGDIIAALAGTGLAAKLRTGGIRADLYPDELELAEAIVALARHDLQFKATAGLHHALRNTDPETGFEQHGFLNLLVATARARAGASIEQVRDALAERDAEVVTDAVKRLDPTVREGFRSFGTCSVREPVDELVQLGLLPQEYNLESSR